MASEIIPGKGKNKGRHLKMKILHVQVSPEACVTELRELGSGGAEYAKEAEVVGKVITACSSP